MKAISDKARLAALDHVLHACDGDVQTIAAVLDAVAVDDSRWFTDAINDAVANCTRETVASIRREMGLAARLLNAADIAHVMSYVFYAWYC